MGWYPVRGTGNREARGLRPTRVGACREGRIMRDYYAILGLPKTATSAEIDAAFRGLARKYHPDVQPEGPDATVQFKLATEAHDVLSNAEKRREYDHVHHSGRRVPISEGTSVTSPLNKPSKGPPSGPLDVEAELAPRARGGPPRRVDRTACLCAGCLPCLRWPDWRRVSRLRRRGSDHAVSPRARATSAGASRWRGALCTRDRANGSARWTWR